MCIDPNDPNKIMVVSGNGIFGCDNIWDEKPEFYFKAKGIEETVPMEMVSIPGGQLVTAIGDYDGFAQDDAAEYGTIHNSAAGTMTSIAVAAQAKDIWVKCGGDKSTHGFWYTEDAGKTWVNVKNSPLDNAIGYAGSVAVSSDGSQRKHHLDSRTVRVRDDEIILGKYIGIDLRHNKFLGWIHAPA